MAKESDYKCLYGTETGCRRGVIGVKILVYAPGLDLTERYDDKENEKIRYAAMDACKAVYEELNARIISLDPLSSDEAVMRRHRILECFEQLIFVEEIPNRYCSLSCCRHLPWFVVTTSAGRFTIGWRKRVIAIEWEDKRVCAEELFKEEDTTKTGNGIHAWSYDKAKEYIAKVVEQVKLLNSANLTTSNL